MYLLHYVMLGTNCLNCWSDKWRKGRGTFSTDLWPQQTTGRCQFRSGSWRRCHLLR